MKLSIVTINLNNKLGLEKTIQSVIHQTNKAFEYIVIDGNSNDGSVELIKNYDKFISYWISESDGGIYNAMNKGIDLARGEYILFINSGDILYSDNVVDSFLTKDTNADFVVGNMYRVYKGILEYSPSPLGVTFLDFIDGSLMHPSTFTKSSLLKEYHYNENYRIISDWLFCIEQLIYMNRSYEKLNFVVSVFDDGGISYSDLSNSERNDAIQKLLPVRIQHDYNILINIRKKRIMNISQLNRHTRVNSLILSIVKKLMNLSIRLNRSEKERLDNLIITGKNKIDV